MSKKQAAQGAALITVSKPGVGESHDQEVVGSLVVSEDPFCQVETGAGITLNVGNYQSVRLDVSVRMPCKPDEIDQVFEFAKGWVDEKLAGLRAEVEGSSSEES